MPRDVSFYLSKGFDLPTAEYFAAGRKKVVSVQPRKDFSLLLIFDNNEKRILDCTTFLKEGTVFAPFLDYENFQRVYIDDTHSVAWDIDPNVDSEKVWSNKVDISSDTCYLDSTPLQTQKIS